MSPYILALGANLCFSSATIVFTRFSHSVGSVWMNTVKAIIATALFFLSSLFFIGWHDVSYTSLLFFIASGLMGLCIGDVFLLNAFREIGPSRTLVIFGFQPILIGFLSFLLFNQEIQSEKIYAIFFFLCCLITFSRENFKKNKSWGLKGISMALFAIVLDGIGIVMTRYAFDASPEVHVLEGNFYRGFGACLGFFVLNLFKPIYLKEKFQGLSKLDKPLVVAGSVLGTFLSLFLYLSALKVGHLASIAGITITAPIFASIWECALGKKWPSGHLLVAFFFFITGMSFLVF